MKLHCAVVDIERIRMVEITFRKLKYGRLRGHLCSGIFQEGQGGHVDPQIHAPLGSDACLCGNKVWQSLNWLHSKSTSSL